MRSIFLSVLIWLGLMMPAWAGEAESVYARVMRTGTIRCGYFIEPPFTMKDPNTGKLSGMVPDMMESMGDALGLKIEWTQEIVDYSLLVPDLQNNRYDMTCASVWVIPERIKLADHSVTYAYAPAHVYIRADENRIKAPDDLDNKDYKIAYTEGDAVGRLTKKRFPSAKLYALSSMSAFTDYLNAVATNKADATIASPSVFAGFDKNNPGKLKSLTGDAAVFVMPTAFMMKRDNGQFKSMIDAQLNLMFANGEYDQLVRKYKGNGKIFYPPAKPY